MDIRVTIDILVELSMLSRISVLTSVVASVSRSDVGPTLANVGATLETDVGQRRHDNAHLLRADIGSLLRPQTLARHRANVGFISIAGPS